MTSQAKFVLGCIVAVIIFFFALWLWPFTSVGAGQVGVVTLFGKVQDQSLTSGLHVVNPFVSVHKISVQTQTLDFENNEALSAASKDLQDVAISVVVTYHLPDTMANSVYRQYQGLENFENSQISPVVREAVKAVSAQYTAEELVTKRAEVSERADKSIREKLTALNIVAESFKIVNLEFSKQFTEAIERKATAVQDAETAKNKLVQVQYERDQRVAQAEGEAKAIQIQAQAINSQGGADYVQLKAIEKWDGHLPGQMIPGSTLPFINLTK